MLPIKRNTMKQVIKEWDLYVLSIPGLVLLIIFSYIPIYGLTIAFKDFNIHRGILGSEWVGLEHFRYLFSNSEFIKVIWNTLWISILNLTFGFPVPIILALMLNEVRKIYFKSAIQTFTYLPHFLSWVVVSGIFIDLLSPNGGIVNTVIKAFGIEPVFFMGNTDYFRGILVITKIWKECGWEAIIYIAAISSIDPELYQAAGIDGAGRFKQVWHITISGIRSSIVILFILKVGYIMSAGMEQVLMMYNPSVYNVADIIDTYIYRIAFNRLEFSITTAAGLFKSVVGCILMLITDRVAKSLGENGVF